MWPGRRMTNWQGVRAGNRTRFSGRWFGRRGEMDLCLCACVLFVLITLIKLPLINKRSLAETEMNARSLK